MATFTTDPRAITDMTSLNLYGLTSYQMSLTPTSVRYSDIAGNYVMFSGTGIRAELRGMPHTDSVTGYFVMISGIKTQMITGLNLGPGEFEGLMHLGYSGGEAAQELFWRGNDTITGGDFGDRLTGRGGSDALYGGKGADTLDGGTGNDRLFGGADNDLLSGGYGADTMTGGAGMDDMTGGTGADSFVFKDISETAKATAKADIIRDFERGLDRIDLSAIDANAKKTGNQAFHFIGADKFSGHAGELRAVAVGENTHVVGDVNGDGRADFDINLNGLLKLSASDFVL